MTRPEEAFYEDHEFAAKEVRSLGGNDGFEHIETVPPQDLVDEIEETVRMLYGNGITSD
jgi:hypothetical protein